jgi:hypothetical protein
MGALVRNLEVNDMLALLRWRAPGRECDANASCSRCIGRWLVGRVPRLLESSLNKHELTKEQSGDLAIKRIPLIAAGDRS